MKEGESGIMIVGLNPALQRTLTLNNIQLGEVLRARAAAVGIGGKGQNAMIASSCMKLKKPSNLLQFLGSGYEGDHLLHLLRETLGDIDTKFSVRTISPCRTCITLIDVEKNSATEVIEPSGNVNLDELEQLRQILKSEYTEQKLSALAVMGSMLPDCPISTYADIIRSSCGTSTRVLLDTTVGVKEALVACGCKGIDCEVLLKVNIQELLKLCDLGSFDQKNPQIQLRKAADTVAELVAGSKKTFIAITAGPDPAYFMELSSGRIWIVNIPTIDSITPSGVCYPIGAGDAVSSGTVHHWGRAIDADSVSECDSNIPAALDAFLWGISCGSVSCTSPFNSIFDMETVQKLYPSITFTEIQ